MNPLIITYALNGLLMIAMPVGLAIFLARVWKLGWRVWWIGFATFVLSQVGHIPFNLLASRWLNQSGMVYWSPTAQLLFNAAFLGLSAGIFEEGARYLVLRFWAREARSWRNGVIFGAGHVGSEAIILGVLVLFVYIQMLILNTANPDQLAQLIPAEQIELVQTQVAAYWSSPWHLTLLGALERLFTIPCQIAMAVLVMKAVTQKRAGWLLAAVLYHAVLDASAVIGIQFLSPIQLEGAVAIFALISVLVIFKLKTPEPVSEQPASQAPQKPTIGLAPVLETPENIDETRFQ
jgi:uncharacterized membrane protein YhfC